MRGGIILMTLLAIAAQPSDANAGDHSNLEDGLPIEVEDAYAIAFRGREVQGLARYERTDSGDNRFQLEPRVEVGVLPNFQAKLQVPFYLGSADQTGSGDIEVGLLYNFNTEALVLPAFGVAVDGRFPTGEDSDGVELHAKVLMTKTLPGGLSVLHRLHVNAEWTQEIDAGPAERDGRYALILGYSIRVGADTFVVADVFRREERSEDEESNMAELGVRRQITPLLVLALGAGAGFPRRIAIVPSNRSVPVLSPVLMLSAAARPAPPSL